MMASTSARSARPAARASSPVIHWLSPVRVATRPSRLAASLARIHGRPWRIAKWNAMFSASASASSTPTTTSTPAARSRAMPLPLTRGLGSVAPMTTRATPARTSASAQGPVRPTWLHGSSVE
jgi:hypothetical protein